MATYEVIAHTEVGAGGSASVTFSSISAGYETLRLVAKLRGETSATTQECMIRFNSDTGTNYNQQNLDSSTNTAVATRASGAAYISFIAAGATSIADTFTPIDCWLPGYSSTSFFKPASITAGGIISTTLNDNRTYMIAGEWLATAAIATILVQPVSGDIAQYSTLTLYGINGA